MITAIKLVGLNNETTVLKLHSDQKPYSVENIVKSKHTVKEDMDYTCSLELDCSETEEPAYQNGYKINIFINKDEKRIIFDGNNILFVDSNNKTYWNIFKDCIGFIQFRICIIDDKGNEKWFYSELASVLVVSGHKIDKINSMIDYVYHNQSDLLKGSLNSSSIGNQNGSRYDDFRSQIILLEEIASVYESCYGFYKANSRYKLDQVEVVDRVDHLKYIDAKTLYYMTQHPEYLHREQNGIRYKGVNYLPTKTLMLQNKITKDIYENRIIVTFLKKVIVDCTNLRNKIDDCLKNIFINANVESGYVSSAYILYVGAKDALMEYNKKIDEIKERLSVLLGSYMDAFGIEDVREEFQLKPTAIFLSVPQYNRIYLCIRKWLDKTGYDLTKELSMLNFYDVPSIYEAYVLIKLINQFKSWGYSLVESKRILYSAESGWMYENKEYNNTFIFKDDVSTVTIYYTPIIYDFDNKEKTGISLYRNNSVSLKSGLINGKAFYSPDFLIKCETEEKVRYCICDAKWTRFERLRDDLMPDLIYKYISSISPADKESELVGMNIFYGISIWGEHELKNFYDKQLDYKINPFISMIPMGVEVGWEENEINLQETLHYLTR